MTTILKTILTIVICSNIQAFSNTLTLYALNVGQANCCVIEKDNYRILVDAGCSANPDNVVEFLGKGPIKPIDMVFISHPHTDHYNLFASNSIIWDQLCKELQNTKFFLSGNKTFYTRLINSLDLHNKSWWTLEEHRIMEFSWRNTNWLFYGRDTKGLRGNALSQIIQIKYLGKKILLTGDADRATLMSMENTRLWDNEYREYVSNTIENMEYKEYNYYDNEDYETSYIPPYLYNTALDWEGDVIVAPHHGSASNGSLALTQNINNTTDLIICSDPFTRHKLPKISSIIFWDQLKNPNLVYSPYCNFEGYFSSGRRSKLCDILQGLGMYVTGLNPVTAYYKILIPRSGGVISYVGQKAGEQSIRYHGMSGGTSNFKETPIKKLQPSDRYDYWHSLPINNAVQKIAKEYPYLNDTIQNLRLYFQNAGEKLYIPNDDYGLNAYLIYKKVKGSNPKVFNDFNLIGQKIGLSDPISEKLKRKLRPKLYPNYNFETVYALVKFSGSEYKILRYEVQ